jgi:hypothetical protein
MNRLLWRMPQQPQSVSRLRRTRSPRLSRADVERLLREAAYVLALTRRVKQSILSEPSVS